jgi:hypothetical protein
LGDKKVKSHKGQFVNWTNKKALDVSGGKDAEGQAVIVYGNHGKVNQQWSIVYMDTFEGIDKEGMNEDFGFEVNRPFYIRSRLPMKRVAEMVGASNIVLKRYVKGRNAQQFVFDPVSKTIRSNHWKNYCIEIQGNGGNQNLRATSGISSRWW